MKQLLAVVLLSVCACASTYYVSSSAGNDSNSGASPATAWKTLGKVNGSTFNPGDKILLARGDVWNESLIPPSSGTNGNPISFDAYGSGAPPEISGKRDLSGWSPYATNVWSAPLTSPSVAYAVFNSIWGQKQTGLGSIQHDRDFMLYNNMLLVYSPTAMSPATYYGTVSAIVPLNSAGSDQAISVNAKTWLTFQHIRLSWYESFGVAVSGASDHLVFANMEADGMVPAGPLPHGFYVNATGSPTDLQFLNVEVRWSDSGWGAGNDRNLIGRFTTRGFVVPRLGRVQDYFLRQYDNSSPQKYSRYSTALHLDYPF